MTLMTYLARVDKLSKQNAGIKYLLIAVDCLSHFLRVEPLKSKYALTTAEAFKQMIKHKQTKMFGWTLERSLRETLKHFAR